MPISNRSLPSIKIDKEDAPDVILENILQVIIEESLHRPSMLTLVVRNDYQPGDSKEEPWERQKPFQIGKIIKVGFSASVPKTEADQKKTEEIPYLFEGEITALETQFTEQTQAPIIVRAYDHSHRLHRGYHNRSFQNMTDSDVVEKIADEVGLEIDKLDDSGEPHDYIFQENQTNMAFLRQRAARIGFELFARDGKLNFREPKSEEPLELTWLDDLRSFGVQVTSAEQVKSVEVRGWDYTTKEPIIATADEEKLLTEIESSEKSGTKASQAFEKPQEPKRIVVDQPVFKRKEADAIAQAVCNEIGGQFVQGDAMAEGNPEIRPGRTVKLKELGPYTGEYYITETRHTYINRVYDTEFSVRGLRGGDLTERLADPSPLKPGQTLLVGIVTDNEDPDELGRVKVKFPTLTEDHNSNWARVVSMGAGNSRGFDCLPEIDDEVLVAFEHGDIHRPYVLGGVWNGEDAPPNTVSQNVQDGKVRLRTIQTRTGHKIQFVEEDQSEKAGVYVETKGGHKLSLNDSSQMMELMTSGGHRLCLNDQGKSISMSSTGNISIQAVGQITINGKMIMLN
ncbi:VgrG-related protein [Leptolyngbya cf. ectocarpi LEGE 11479]|uniref:VgrG-related protein n=1 Tax=Leptolyngbya cf. ectocarpi LEGE 11479 TaxID=1828722 RepID=A0A929F8E6_LEPEC|nr:VgrG-related protein [Leptolyngbya ectocarpi]MBE9068781.1 VgrG-related protein [Leptolyngbya cf. ectocarpi LEGE 11479]